MTSRFSAESEGLLSAANAESSATGRIADEGPYARPNSIAAQSRAVDAVLIDAIRASVGPFVPAPWRAASILASPVQIATAPSFQESADESSSDSATVLPWIESFLDTAEVDADPAAEDSMLAGSGAGELILEEAVAIESDAKPTLELDDTDLESMTDSPIQSSAALSERTEALINDSAVESAPIVAEEWPLEEAGAAMRALADDLVRDNTPEAPAEPAASDVASPEDSTAPLRMWSDDDMMDIMPVRTVVTPVRSEEQWATRARRETQGAGNPESAAQALESLARRVRSGEIQLPVFSADMGEAAALAAALAALLAVRR